MNTQTHLSSRNQTTVLLITHHRERAAADRALAEAKLQAGLRDEAARLLALAAEHDRKAEEIERFARAA